MDLNRKVFWIIVITMAGSLTAMGVVADQVILESFRRLERSEVQEDLDRAVEAVQVDLQDLDLAARDWAEWNDTYLYVQGDLPGYEGSNLVPPSFENNRVDAMAFFDRDGALVQGLSLAGGALAPIDPDVLEAMREHGLDRAPGGISRLGLMAGGGTWKVAARPILQSDGAGPSMGTLVWARQFGPDDVAELEEQTHLTLSLEPAEGVEGATAGGQGGDGADGADGDGEDGGGGGQAELMGGTEEAPLVDRIEQSIRATSLLYDLAGRPILELTVEVPRTTYQEGLRSVAYFVGAMVLAGGAMMVSMTALLDRTVLSRLNRLSAQVEAIRNNPAVVGRVAVPGQDEIGRLAQQFNRLLESSERHMAALERSNQDLEGFARVVSHDLQPHLSTILLNAAILRQTSEGNDPSVANRLDRIEGTAKRMAQLMRGILDYSSASSTRGAWSDVDLQQLMEEVVSTLEESIAKTNARVEWRGLPTVSGNPVQLQQLLQNLVGNALKYHRPGVPPEVKVTASPALDLPGGHRIEVRDNGQGFDPTRFNDMVQPFFRLKEGSDGHGLGLATCVKIAQRHGGSLTADSVPGQGSSFFIELPAAGQATAPAAAA